MHAETGRHDPFTVDRERALEALRFTWGDAYDISAEDGLWQARRKDSLGGPITASLPDSLNRDIRDDWTLNPVRSR
jgi:hypothetical protein